VSETWRQFWHLLKRDVPAFIALIWLVLTVILCTWGYFTVQAASLRQNLNMRLIPPGTSHGLAYLLGTDGLGRSYVERLLVAGATSLVIAASVVAISAVIGGALGIISGNAPSAVDTVIMRVCDVIMAFPSMLLALVALYTISTSPVVLIGVLAFTRLPIYIRTARGEALRTRGLLYISAARMSGTRPMAVTFRHIVRAALPAVWTLVTFEIALTMLTESGLSFLGVGIQPPGASWGLLVSDGQTYLYSSWWVAVLPGIAIMATAVALRVLGGVVSSVLEG
jgi:peptide/nickel transport system permease protein